MTNAERFYKAHATAKQIRNCFSCYRDAFAFALAEVYTMERNAKAERTTAEKLEALGIDAWERGEMKRYYMNDAAFEAVFGLSIDRYKTGNICSAVLNGEGISNAKAGRLIGRGVFYDAVAGEWFRADAFGKTVLDGELRDALRI